jgi:hypothetical protein
MEVSQFQQDMRLQEVNRGEILLAQPNQGEWNVLYVCIKTQNLVPTLDTHEA